MSRHEELLQREKDKLEVEEAADNQEPSHFGDHLTIDGYGGDPGKLNDKELVCRALNELPDLLGMSKLGEPQVYFAPGNGAKDPGGWSGFVVIAESHISIHTFPARRFVSIDAYSCKAGMDQAFVTRYFREKFDLNELETNFIRRGTRYPLCNIC